MRDRQRKSPGCVSGAARGRIQSCNTNPTNSRDALQSKSIDRAAQAYTVGDHGVARYLDVANRFCSALFHAARGGAVPEIITNYEIPIDAMPTPTHRAALRGLIGFIECGIAPTVAQLATVMQALGVTDDALPELLPFYESTPAGIHNWAHALIRADRRRRQTERLWLALIVRCEDPTAPTYGAKPVRIVSRVRGKGAA